jgi:hypothetical protein
MNEELEFPPNGQSIDLLRAVYRNPSIPLPVRMRAAIAALPHETPRLMVSAQVNEHDFATLLDQRIKRFEEMKLIEQQPTPTANGAAVEVKPPLPRVGDRRFRRI